MIQNTLNIEDIKLVNYIPETGENFYVAKDYCEEILKLILNSTAQETQDNHNNSKSGSNQNERLRFNSINDTLLYLLGQDNKC